MPLPSKYKDTYPDDAYILCANGATNKDLAEAFKVTTVTVDAWRKKYPVFADAVKRGKNAADENVEKSLYQRATGYSHAEDKIFQHNGEPVVVPTTRYYPPDATSLIFWLKNRKPKDWRDKQEIDVGAKDTLAAAFLKASKELDDKG